MIRCSQLGPTKVDEHGIGKNVVFIGKGYRLFEKVSSRESIPRKDHNESVDYRWYYEFFSSIRDH